MRTRRSASRTGPVGPLAAEQGTDDDPAVLAELAELNGAYEERFGFRFVVFVNRRPRREIVPILRERLERTREPRSSRPASTSSSRSRSTGGSVRERSSR